MPKNSIHELSLALLLTHKVNIRILANLGALRAPLPGRTPDRWSRTNPKFEQI